MRILHLTLLLAFIPCAAHAKLDKRALESLKGLDPKSRLEQVCGVEAMDRIGADQSNNHEPDRALADATSSSVLKDDKLIVQGGAIRSHHHWYHLSYTCIGTSDHLGVLKFTYKIGSRIPDSEWEADSLWY